MHVHSQVYSHEKEPIDLMHTHNYKFACRRVTWKRQINIAKLDIMFDCSYLNLIFPKLFKKQLSDSLQ